VFDGKGLAVSEGAGVPVNVWVGVMETVWVAVGSSVSVTGAKDVFAGKLVPTTVGAPGVAVSVQANEVTMHTRVKMSFRPII
jgi:hypothetical protein